MEDDKQKKEKINDDDVIRTRKGPHQIEYIGKKWVPESYDKQDYGYEPVKATNVDKLTKALKNGEYISTADINPDVATEGQFSKLGLKAIWSDGMSHPWRVEGIDKNKNAFILVNPYSKTEKMFTKRIKIVNPELNNKMSYHDTSLDNISKPERNNVDISNVTAERSSKLAKSGSVEEEKKKKERLDPTNSYDYEILKQRILDNDKLTDEEKNAKLFNLNKRANKLHDPSALALKLADVESKNLAPAEGSRYLDDSAFDDVSSDVDIDKQINDMDFLHKIAYAKNVRGDQRTTYGEAMDDFDLIYGPRDWFNHDKDLNDNSIIIPNKKYMPELNAKRLQVIKDGYKPGPELVEMMRNENKAKADADRLAKELQYRIKILKQWGYSKDEIKAELGLDDL